MQRLFQSMVLLSLIGSPPPIAAQGGPDYLSELEQEILDQLNFARSQPLRLAQTLREYRARLKGKILHRPGRRPMRTREGREAVDEAIRFLESTTPLGPLVPSRGMSRACRDHVRDIGSSGSLSHQGADESTPAQRAQRYGRWSGRIGENLSFADFSAQETVVGLIVDDGVPGRGHRKVIFDPEYAVVGIACGAHREYGKMCAILFAVGYREGTEGDR